MLLTYSFFDLFRPNYSQKTSLPIVLKSIFMIEMELLGNWNEPLLCNSNIKTFNINLYCEDL